MLELKTKEPLAVSGGPLAGVYLFKQLHFHWGHNDSVGSEDTINNHRFVTNHYTEKGTLLQFNILVFQWSCTWCFTTRDTTTSTVLSSTKTA
jgi:hypothetical protein